MTQLTVAELTTANLGGNGVFDVLMRSVKAHLEAEFTKGRIKGPEYSTVYLGSVDLAMKTGLQFLLEQRKNDLEAQLLEKQIELATVEVDKANAQLALLEAGLPKVTAEIAHLEAQTSLIGQQKINLVAEGLNIPKQGLLLDAQKEQSEAQTAKLGAELTLTTAITSKTTQELLLLTQKTVTEKAQTSPVGVDPDSVIGKQKALYTSQSDGFKRDAEQKAAKVLADTWSVRRTTDEATVADATNMLYDTAVGRAITKLLTGVDA